MTLLHNSHDLLYRSPFGAVTPGCTVKLSLCADRPIDGAFLHCNFETDISGERVFEHASVRCVDGSYFYDFEIMPGATGLIWYYFSVSSGGAVTYYGNNEQNVGGVGQQYSHLPPSFQITVYNEQKTPDWYKHGIIYQIFPDRFARGSDYMKWVQNGMRAEYRDGSTRFLHLDWHDVPFYPKDEKGAVLRWGFFGGTLSGIRERLVYLKSLGVGTLYLNPIFEAASNHRYDTGDYMRIDPLLGDESEFEALISEAKALDIHIMLDGVFSHCGADSKYFNKFGNYDNLGAYQGEQSEYYDRFRFKNFPDEYDCWWGVDDLPNVDELNPDYLDFICGEDGVVAHWIKKGAKAWRLDVADELPGAFIEGLRTAAKTADPEAFILGEVWEDASYKISYGERTKYFGGAQLDAVMNYPFKSAMLDFALNKTSAQQVDGIFMSLKENYPPSAFYSGMNLLGTHDTERVLNLLCEAQAPKTESARERHKLSPQQYDLAKRRLIYLSALQFASPGVPSVYYGDEAGVTGFKDPFNRSTFPWGRQDEQITGAFRFASYLRQVYEVLREGDFKACSYHKDVYGFWRFNEKEGVYTAANRSFEPRTVEIALDFDFAVGTPYIADLLGGHRYQSKEQKISVTIAPMSAIMLYVRPEGLPKMQFERGAGIICHITSLPHAQLGLYRSACEFIDFLSEAGQKYWQILPLNPPDEFDSPYASQAVFAYNDAVLSDAEIAQAKKDGNFKDFCKQQAYWLDDYALYTALKSKNNGLAWQFWPEDEKNRTKLDLLCKKYAKQIEHSSHRQYAFHLIWSDIRKYAAQKGISIVGDMPIYTSGDSADVWAHPELFSLDSDGSARLRAGVPPDAFTDKGQLWGNPIYNIKKMAQNDFLWWRRRLKHAEQNYDAVRIDHFRAFAAYYAVAGGEDARQGFWAPGFGKRFFDIVLSDIGKLKIIAEDLGQLDTAVYDLLDYCGFPGMDIYQFTADSMMQMPPEVQKHRIFYSGTHDNQTLMSWLTQRTQEPKCDCECQCDLRALEIFDKLYMSDCAIAMLPLQDVLFLYDTARMNTPGTTSGNWNWQYRPEQLSRETAGILRALAQQSDR